MFYHETMVNPDLDRALAAQIAGVTARYAEGRQLTTGEEAMAIAELKQAAAGRGDLLAEHAGAALGFGEGRPDAARYRQVAELCITAGADLTLVKCWTEIARQRAAVVAATSRMSLTPEAS